MVSDREIQELIERYERMRVVVNERLHALLKEGGEFPLLQIKSRVKTLESIKGKLVRKPDLYPNIYELRDILGFRAICYLANNVDIVAEKIAGYFRVDWSRSKDKRKLIDARSFGYLSIHFICALPEEDGEFSDLWFEIQLRTILQHSWAEIEHDLGYKAEIEVPRDIRRSFSRAASLLETTDIIFAQIKQDLDEYKNKVKRNIESDSLNEVFFDGYTLAEFTDHNYVYRSLLDEIAAITNAHITEGQGRTKNLLLQIDFLKIDSFSDMIKVIEEEHGLIMRLARESLHNSGLEELSSTVGYYYIFRAKLLSSGWDREKLRSFFALTMRSENRIENSVNRIMKDRERFVSA